MKSNISVKYIQMHLLLDIRCKRFTQKLGMVFILSGLLCINERPMPDESSAACFLCSPRLIVYKYDSHVDCTLRECQSSYMSF